MATGAVSGEARSSLVIHDGFSKDRTRRVAGTKKQHVERAFHGHATHGVQLAESLISPRALLENFHGVLAMQMIMKMIIIHERLGMDQRGSRGAERADVRKQPMWELRMV